MFVFTLIVWVDNDRSMIDWWLIDDRYVEDRW